MDAERENGDAKGEKITVVSSDASGNVRTVFVFLDVPVHYEFRAGSLPLLFEGKEIVFDSMTLRGKDAARSRVIEGTYVVQRQILRFGSTPRLVGLTQYLEVSPASKG